MQRAGFIGLGVMGAPMAKKIVPAGCDLSVFDVRPENTGPLVERGSSLGLSEEDDSGVVRALEKANEADRAEDSLRI